MENTIKELKKLGNKIYSVSAKIQECETKGMVTRIPAYFQDLEKMQTDFDSKIQELKSQIKL